MGAAQTAVASGAGLAGTVGQHVGRLTQHPGIDLAHFVQDEQTVIVERRHAFQSVVRDAPAFDVARAAPDGCRHLQGRRLAGRAPAFKAEAAPLHAGQAQQGPGKGEAQREDKAGIARAQGGDLAPAVQRAARLEHLRMPG